MSTDVAHSSQPPPRGRPFFLLAFALCLCLAPIACAQRNGVADPAPATQQPQTSAAYLPSFAEIVRNVLPAVVNISATRSSRSLDEDQDKDNEEGAPDFGPGSQAPLEEFLRRFFGEQAPLGRPNHQGSVASRTALGSGFIIDAEGYVVTDTHVIAGAERVSIVLQDNSRYSAKIVGQDEVSDLALLKIDAGRPVPSVTWGNSDTAQVGDWILAVGNPFGLGGTVSAGIVSARGRDIHAGPFDDFLQIDAPLNSGNSGGPTFNLAGQVIGINTAIYTPSGGSVGIGFAIPSNLAKPVIDQLRAHGKVARGWLGVQLQEVTPGIARGFGLAKAEGVLVVDVTAGGPADKAGIRQGDVIIRFNGREITRVHDLSMAVADAPVGTTATMTVLRGGKRVAVGAVIADRPQELPAPTHVQAKESATARSMGLTLAPLTDDLRRELRLPATLKGVVVMDISEGSPLADSGLERGDVIEEINRKAVTTPQAAATRLKEALSTGGRNVLLLIDRQGTKQYLAFSPNSGDLD